MTILNDPRVDRALLDRYGFDAERFEREVARIADGTLTDQSAMLTEEIKPASDVVDVDWSDTVEARDLKAKGEQALRAGKLAVMVLNGGMATRFGNVVKGTVEVFDGHSFLALKARDISRASNRYGCSIPFVMMNSFATQVATKEHFAAHDHFGLDEGDIHAFVQSISIRLDLDGGLFIGDDGAPSYHSPGHGDFFACIRRSGVLAALRDRGVETIAFSNVDNLGATVDPTVLGHHIASGAAMTAEVTAKRRTASGAWDKGGAPCVVAGHQQLVEGFRFPPDLPPTFLPDFSTNNFLFSAAAIDQEVPLARHVVKKKVDGRPALQLESITCEASAVLKDGRPLLPLGLLRVPRDGAQGRFFPVKERVDLDAMRDTLKARLT